ncbi:unnamed protein product [Parnassius apollo]|uniref:(apollo) hypothetical protein n=1 Tax=Parnassius apollo TaxID=110799 RepID=A0A8S3WQP7_PARAO|nr:unnamed protein product [Parnassius apollo]
MHRLFAELEPSVNVTEQNLADRVRYILRSNIFDVADLERLRRESVPSSDENATAEDAAPQIIEQPANVDAAVNTPVVVDLKDDGTVAQELEIEHMRNPAITGQELDAPSGWRFQPDITQKLTERIDDLKQRTAD